MSETVDEIRLNSPPAVIADTINSWAEYHRNRVRCWSYRQVWEISFLTSLGMITPEVDMPTGHGIVGQIVPSINGSRIVVTGDDDDWGASADIWADLVAELHRQKKVLKNTPQTATPSREPVKWESILARELQSVYGWRRKEIKQLIVDIKRRISPEITQDEIGDLEKRVNGYCTYWMGQGYGRRNM